MTRLAFLLACALPNAAMAAPGEKLVHSFGGPHDGSFPIAGALVADAAGTLYGTASSGGAHDAGVVFSLAKGGKGWTYAVLHDFGPGEGAGPYGSLLLDSVGALLGTTTGGGTAGQGTAFRLAPPAKPGKPWQVQTLWSFAGGTDGAAPYAGLIAGNTGTLYGTTYEGGTAGLGTVFSLAPPAVEGGAWTETVLYRFTGFTNGGADGAGPAAPVVFGADGALYGTAESGGLAGVTPGCSFPDGCGVAFRIALSGGVWQESLLHVFGGTPEDGASPEGGLVFDAGGTAYSTTSYGGGDARGFIDHGTVYALSPPAGGTGPWTYTVLKEMAESPDFLSYPIGGLAMDATGTLTGAALDGGPGGDSGLPTHGGGVFTLTPPPMPGGAWTYAVRHEFTSDSHDFCKSGCYPYADPALLAGGAVIGTTLEGGTYRPHGSKVGAGVVYELK